jgi:endonuclease-3
MLSSQTKDTTTSVRMAAMHEYAHKLGSQHGITPSVIRTIDQETLSELLLPVSFHKTKAKHLKQVAEILQSRNDECPDRLDEVLDLPGVGPKMAHLYMHAAHDFVTGIGVDTHVHRITRLLHFTPAKANATPETTRVHLESWLPKEYWGVINHLLVGLGQTICPAKSPRCHECPINDLCPSSSFKPSKNK